MVKKNNNELYKIDEYKTNLNERDLAQIRQGVMTNQLTKIVANKDNTKLDVFTGISIYQKNQDFQLNFINTDFSQVRGYTATTSILSLIHI